MNKFIFKNLTKFFITIIIFIDALIFVKTSNNNKELLYNKVFDKNISFASVNKTAKKYLGNILPIDDIVPSVAPVFNEKITYQEVSKYKDGIKLTVDYEYAIPAIESGLVVYVGTKKGYGKTVIVEQENEIEMWYGNLATENVELYDYVDKGNNIGISNDESLFLICKKDGEFIDCKEYIE